MFDYGLMMPGKEMRLMNIHALYARGWNGN